LRLMRGFCISVRISESLAAKHEFLRQAMRN
jgi:hypothetical protein